MNTQEPISEKRTTRVYTKLKFVKSDVSGATVSFVSQNPKTGRICGVCIFRRIPVQHFR